MSVIQSIRDKYARWAVVAIALSLLGFILMDAFAGRSSVFGGNSTTVGSVNGKKIEVQDFEQKIKMQEDNMQQQGYAGGETRYQAIENVWNGEIEQALLADEFEKLGMTVGKKELNDVLFGMNPPADIKKGFTDPTTGQFNLGAAQQYFANLRKTGTPEQKAQMNQYLANLEFQRLAEKYSSLLGNSNYFPKWMIEKQNADNSLMGKISFVAVPYASISDSSVKISEDDVRSYMNEHKDEFEQEDETRSISYVVFNASPSRSDSIAASNGLSNLKNEFSTTKDDAAFLARNGSTITATLYVPASQIQVPGKDSIFTLPSGGVFGPYLDAGNYTLAKKIDTRNLPDSVKCRHILLGTVDPQSRQPLMPDSVAKQKADSVAAAIRGGANFDSLETKYSTDMAAHQEKGVMTFSSMQIQGEGFAKEFGDFILFNGKAGSKEVIKTSFGYHYIEIMDQKNIQPHHKIAYLSKAIIPSNETDNTAQNAASLFAGDSRNAKSFNDNYEKNLKAKGITRLVATDIKPNDYNINGLGTSRAFVKAVFDADENDVLQPERVGDNYVVALVTEVGESGKMNITKARTMVEPLLRNQKKAAVIVKNLGTISSLEAAATKLGQTVQTADSLRFANNRTNPVLGFENKVIGAAFNAGNKGKVVTQALEGQAGVYVIRVESISTTPVEVAGVEEQRRMMEMQAKQAMAYRSPIIALRKAASIKDNRAKFY
ncbi:MAG TPA: peptidylprolyl isomerase [Chitinophagaceae bacterium]|jgi:peptidyl-prolyl cis-trans isomerase D|nr:peptidylprolyl isomerase [Chitinophagaceae bacterium]